MFLMRVPSRPILKIDHNEVRGRLKATDHPRNEMLTAIRTLNCRLRNRKWTTVGIDCKQVTKTRIYNQCLAVTKCGTRKKTIDIFSRSRVLIIILL